MNPPATQRFYLPQLDGLRFFAFLLVFIHNAPADTSIPLWNALHEYGWIGVDLFFCLSGYLITKLLVLEYQETGGVNIRNFYMRRALRILPLYFLYIPVALIITIQDQGWQAIFLNHVLGLISFTYDFTYLFLTSKIIFILVHLWTISYEVQFYLAIPWVVQKIMKITTQSKWGGVGILFMSGTAIRAIFIYLRIKHPAIYMLPFTHFEALLGGVVIGLGLFAKPLQQLRGDILLLAGILCNTAAFILPNTYEIGWSLMLTYPLVGFGMILIVAGMINGESPSILKFLKHKTPVYLGKISYGLYIFHLLSLTVADKILKMNMLIPSEDKNLYYGFILSIGLLISVLFANISYQWIEKPFLNLKNRFPSITARSL